MATKNFPHAATVEKCNEGDLVRYYCPTVQAVVTHTREREHCYWDNKRVKEVAIISVTGLRWGR